MSLCISLDGEADHYYSQHLVDNVNRTLKEIGIMDHEIAPQLINSDVILPCIDTKSFDIDCLQFVAAKLKEDPAWRPDADFIRQPINPDVKEQFILENRSHLICHSRYYGCYVPIDFHDISLPPKCLLDFGSSFNLCDELKAIAKILNFDLGDYNPDFDLLLQQRYYELENDPIFSEKMLILYLYNMCLGSIKHKLTIVFCG
jgi:hypothetical protein